MRNLAEIKGVGETLAAAFVEKGYHSVQDIAEAAEAKLATVPGVSRVRAAQLISSAKLLLSDPSASKTTPLANVTDEDKTPVEPVETPKKDASLETASPALDTGVEKPSVDAAQASGNGKLQSETASSATVADEEKTPAEPAEAPKKDASFETASPARNTDLDRPTIDAAQTNGNGKLQSESASSKSVTDEEKTAVEPAQAAREDKDMSAETASLVSPTGKSKKTKKGSKKKGAKIKLAKKKNEAKKKKGKKKKSLKAKNKKKDKKEKNTKKSKKNKKKNSKEKSGKKKSKARKKK